MWEQQWKNVQRVLCIRPDNMGDVLMTSPAIRALKHTYPDIQITLLTSSMGAGIVPMIPEIEDVIAFDFPWLKHDHNPSNNTDNLIKELKSKDFDAAILFTTYSQNPLPTALICYQAGIQLVLGYCRENPYGLISHWVPDTSPFYDMKHQVKRDLKLVESIGAKTADEHIKLSIPYSATQSVTKLLEKEKINKNFIILHPGVSEKKRQYPIEEYAKVIDLLSNDGYQIVITGSKSEKQLEEELKKYTSKCISLIGRTNLEEMIALIDDAKVLIANNTGPVHIAAGTKTPVVVLYALTNPEHLPWETPYKALYFNVEKGLESKNTILKYSTQKYFKEVPKPTGIDIYNAVQDLLEGKNDTAEIVDLNQ